MAGTIDIFPGEALIRQEDFARLYEDVYLQLRKDFHPHATMPEQPASLTSTWLFEEVKRMLALVVERQPAVLGPIVYRVDLSEKMVRSMMQSSPEKNRLDELTVLILKREAQKVWTRHMFKTG